MSAVVVLILRILIAAILYLFLGFAMYLMWKNLRKTTDPNAGGSVPVLVLTPSGKGSGAPHRFEQTEVVVGRYKGCQLCIADEAISARHALLCYHNKQWWVEDLGSTNGTYLNGMPVTTPTVLVKDDTLTFGKLAMVVDFV